MGRKGDMPRMSEQDRLMSRYSVAPAGGGAYGIYDNVTQRFTEYFTGRTAQQKASRKRLAIVTGACEEPS